ncbi:MAG: hypothetical protein K2X27_11205 [Candidatus Obscuribacterales bacterium]|nr:hypothetical protein [Candidatus Obscuribacterales bacterium]
MAAAILNTQRRVLRVGRAGSFIASVFSSIAISLSPLSAAMSAESSAENTQPPMKVSLTKGDLATANGSARLGMSEGNMYCVLTSIQTRVQLEPDKWSGDDESTNWTTWLTAFDDNLYARWLKNAPLNAQETVGIRINPDSSVLVTNNTFFPGKDLKDSNAQSSFESAIVTSLNETLKMAKPMPSTVNKLKEVHMSLTFMRDVKALPRVGKNDYGFVAIVGDKDFITVYERTDDYGRFPGIQILTDNDDPGKVVPLEQAAFDQKAAEAEK